MIRNSFLFLSFGFFCLLFPILSAGELPVVLQAESQQALDILRHSLKETADTYYSPSLHAWYSAELSKLPTASQVKDLYPNPVGYGTGMDDNPLFAGVLLVALLDLHKLTGNDEIRQEAFDVYTGLKLCATVHGIRGFVARGICVEDGTSAYITSSRDQYTHFVDALWQYYHSPLCNDKTKKEIGILLGDLAQAMKDQIRPESDYGYLRADGTPDPRGLHKMWYVYAHEAARLPMIYAAAWDTTGNRDYYDLWRRYLPESIDLSISLKSRPKSETDAWVPPYSYFQMQCSLALLYRLERDPDMKNRIAQAIQISSDMVNRKYDWAKKRSSRDKAELLLAQLILPDLNLNDRGKQLLIDLFSEKNLKIKNPPTLIHLLALYAKCCRSGLFAPPKTVPLASWLKEDRNEYLATPAPVTTIRRFPERSHDKNLALFFSDLHISSSPESKRNLDDFNALCDRVLLMKPLPQTIFFLGDLAFNSGKIEDYQLLKPGMKKLLDQGIELQIGLGDTDNRANFHSVFPQLNSNDSAIVQTDYADFLHVKNEQDLPRLMSSLPDNRRFFIVVFKPLRDPKILAALTQLPNSERFLGVIHGAEHAFRSNLKTCPHLYGMMSVARAANDSTRHGFTCLKMDRWEFIFRPVTYNQEDVWERQIRVIRTHKENQP